MIEKNNNAIEYFRFVHKLQWENFSLDRMAKKKHPFIVQNGRKSRRL